MFRFIITLIYTLGVSLLSPSFAQLSLQLSLDDAIRIAQENSPSARMAALSLRADSLDYTAFQASLKPELRFGANLPGLSRSISNISQDNGSVLFREQSQAIASGNFNISQDLGTGGSLFLSTSTLGIFNFQPIDATIWRTSLFVIGLNQPIFQFNNTKWNKINANLSYDLAKTTYAAEREAIAANVTNIFFNALTAQVRVRNEEINVLNNDTIYRISEGRYSVGKIAENELLQSELNLIQAQSNRNQAQLDLDRALQNLRTIMGISTDQEIELLTPTAMPAINYEPEFAVEQALIHSQETKNIAFDTFLANRNLASVNSDNRPSINLNATFGLNQTADNFGDTYRNPQDRQAITMGIDVPIFNWGRAKAEKQAAAIRLENAKENATLRKQQLRDQVYYLMLTLEQLATQLEITQRSEDVAQRRYDISKNRYLIGKISIQDLVIAQSENDRARQEYIRTVSDFWTTYVNIRALTLYDFVEMRPLY